MPEIVFPKDWTKYVNDHFAPLMDNRDRYLILYGGRGSSKSVFTAKKLMHRCLTEKYFRCILIRNVYDTIHNSSWQTLKDTIEEYGLGSLFNFSASPLEIRCANGNKFIAAGCNDTTKIKSVKDPSCVWYEEDIISEDDFITITTSVRTTKAEYLQEIFSINPEVKEGKFEDNWFFKRFFLGHPHKTFRHRTEITFKLLGVEQKIEQSYTAHHSTYQHNKHVPLEFMAFLESLKISNPYYYTIYCLGEWGNKKAGGMFYKAFDRPRHLTDEKYSPQHALHLTFDFNVRPYMTLCVWQVFGKQAIQVDEILGLEPFNTTEGVCKIFCARYAKHMTGVYVYGDPSGYAEDTRMERGMNDFDIISGCLKEFNPKFRVDTIAPPVTGRGMWINSVFSVGLGGLQFLFNRDCAYTIMDYTYGKEAADGTKLKERFKDEQDIPAERYHHITDANDYFLCYIFRNEFNTYLRGNREREFTPGAREVTFNRDHERFRGKEGERFRAK